MKLLNKTTFLLVLLLLPICGFAKAVGNMETTSRIIFIVNCIVWLTSAVSIIQLIRHGENNRAPFHVFNMVLVIAFHSISLSFLVHHKDYYDGYQQLSDMDCIKKYFLSPDSSSLIKRVIEIGFICNIIYLARYGKEYYIDSN